MYKTIAATLLAFLVTGCASVKVTRDSVSGRTIARTRIVGAAALSEMLTQDSFSAEVYRMRGSEALTMRVVTQGPVACHSGLMEISVDGDYRVLGASGVPRFNASCPGGNCTVSTSSWYDLPSDMRVSRNSEVRVQVCGVRRRLTKGSIGRLSEIQSMRF